MGWPAQAFMMLQQQRCSVQHCAPGACLLSRRGGASSWLHLHAGDCSIPNATGRATAVVHLMRPLLPPPPPPAPDTNLLPARRTLGSTALPFARMVMTDVSAR